MGPEPDNMVYFEESIAVKTVQIALALLALVGCGGASEGEETTTARTVTSGVNDLSMLPLETARHCYDRAAEILDPGTELAQALAASGVDLNSREAQDLIRWCAEGTVAYERGDPRP